MLRVVAKCKDVAAGRDKPDVCVVYGEQRMEGSGLLTYALNKDRCPHWRMPKTNRTEQIVRSAQISDLCEKFSA